MHSLFRSQASRRAVWRIAAIVPLGLLVLCGGCATATFTAIEGKLRPGALGKNAMVNTDWGMPIYSGPPTRPYVVIGLIRAKGGEGGIKGLTRAAIRQAEINGADGLIVVNAARRLVGYSTTATVGPWPGYGWGGPWPYCGPGYGPYWGPYFGGPYVGVTQPVYQSTALFDAFRWL